MPDVSTKEAITNTTPKSCAEVNCDCNTMWSLAQQFSTKRLCVETGENKGKLLSDYASPCTQNCCDIRSILFGT